LPRAASEGLGMTEEEKLRGKGPKILVVDDEAAVCHLAGACIRHGLGEDYQVSYARNGKKALAAVQKDRPDLILLDILMPVVDGFEVCRQLKGSDATKDIPVVFLTALGKEDDIERGLALGGDGYVVKPFNAVTLAAQISELLAPDREQAQ
jgi:putative two-component system response regulator